MKAAQTTPEKKPMRSVTEWPGVTDGLDGGVFRWRSLGALGEKGGWGCYVSPPRKHAWHFSNGPPEQWVIWWAVAGDFFCNCRPTKNQPYNRSHKKNKVLFLLLVTRKISKVLKKYMKSVLSLHHLDGSFQCGDLGDFVFFAQRELGRFWYLSSCSSYII